MKSAFNRFFIITFCLLTHIAFAQTPESTDPADAVPDFTGNSTSSKKKPKPSTTTTTTQQPTTTTSFPNSTQTTTQPTTTTSFPNNAATPNNNSASKIKIEEDKSAADILPDKDAPLDGIVERKTILDKQVLPYEPIRESDILWSKRIWRVIDVREKLNLPFANQEGGESERV